MSGPDCLWGVSGPESKWSANVLVSARNADFAGDDEVHRRMAITKLSRVDVSAVGVIDTGRFRRPDLLGKASTFLTVTVAAGDDLGHAAIRAQRTILCIGGDASVS